MLLELDNPYRIAADNRRHLVHPGAVGLKYAKDPFLFLSHKACANRADNIVFSFKILVDCLSADPQVGSDIFDRKSPETVFFNLLHGREYYFISHSAALPMENILFSIFSILALPCGKINHYFYKQFSQIHPAGS
jgi:hypothetical protein